MPLPQRVVPKNPSVAKLVQQAAVQEAKLKAQGGKKPSGGGGSILNRVLDLASRGNYAVANAAMAPATGKRDFNLAAAGVRAARGLAGKDKTRFSDVLQQMNTATGGQNPLLRNSVVRAVGGLGLDIATDPLNYVSFGITKAPHALEEAATAGRAIAAGTQRGTQSASLLTRASEAKTALNTANRGAVTLKLAGKPVLQSEKAYDIASKIASPLTKSDTINALTKTMSIKKLLPGGLAERLRGFQQSGVYNVQKWDTAMRKAGLHTLTADEARELSHSILHNRPVGIQMSKSGIDMAQAKILAKDALKTLDDQAGLVGLTRPGQGHPDHVPMFYSTKEYGSDAANRFESATKAARDAGRPLPTFQDALKEGVSPEDNIFNIIRNRSAQVERGSARRNFYDGGIDQYSSQIRGAGSTKAREAMKANGMVPLDEDVMAASSHAHLLNAKHKNEVLYVPEHVNEAFKAVHTIYKQPDEARQLLRAFDNVQRLWKTGVTTLQPGHHVNNLMGDFFLNWVAGVRNPMEYARTLKLMKGTGKFKFGNVMVDAADLHDLIGESGAVGGFAHELISGSRAGGQAVTANPVSKLLQGSPVAAPLERAQMIGRSGYKKVQNFTEAREDLGRFTNFQHQLKQYDKTVKPIKNWDDLREAGQWAGEKVRKYNLDYGGLTRHETMIRRFIPFYTFMRQAAPVMFETAALHPDLMSRIPKYMHAMETAMGMDPATTPISEIIPKYIRDTAAFRIRGEGGTGLNIPGTGKNPLQFDPRLPISDILNLPSGGAQETALRIANMSTFRPLIELGTNTSTLTGQKLGSPGIGEYAASQVPLTRTLYNVLKGPKSPSKVIQPGDRNATIMDNPLFKLLSPIKFRELNPAVQRGEVQRTLDPVQARLKKIRADRINKAAGYG